MTMDTFDRVKNILVGIIGVTDNRIVQSAGLLDDLGVDSLDSVELLTELEDEFGFEIPDEDLEAIITVGDAVKYIDKRLAE